MLRTLTSALGQYDPEAGDSSPQAQLSQGGAAHRADRQHRRHLRAAAGRRRADPAGSGARPRRQLPLHADRRAPDALATRAFDIALVLHADHELNASTFAARVAAATLTDLYSAIVGAIGALKGPLHGGANAEVMRLLHRDRARGHARARRRGDPREAGEEDQDPRLRPSRLSHRGSARDAPAPDVEGPRRARRQHPLVRDVAADRGAGQGEKKLNPNVDFYSASTYYTLGIPIDLFTPIFAVSRVSGWTAHCLEQYANNRLIRPRTDYIGPQYPQAFLPLDQR